MAAPGEFIEGLSESALKDLKVFNDELLKTVSSVSEIQKKFAGVKSLLGSISVNKEVTAEIQKQESAIGALKNQIITLEAANKKLQNSYTQLAASQRAGSESGRRATATTREQSIAQQILRAETDRNFRATTLLGGAYARASAQLLILKREAKDAAIQFGENSKKAREAAAAAAALDQRIKSADAAVGDYQRNVGNYSGAVVTGFQKVFSVVRQLAYILPGIGIAGIFSLALEPLYELIKGTGILSDKMLELRKNTEAYHQALLDIKVDNRESADALESLVKAATNVRLSEEQRAIAVEKLRERYGRFFDQYTDGQIKAGKFGDAVEKINKSLNAQNTIDNFNEYKKTTDARIEAIRNELEERRKFVEQERYYQSIIKQNTEIENEGTKAARNVLNETGKAAKRNLEILRTGNDERKKSLKDKQDETLLYYTDAKLNDIILDYERKRGDAQAEITRQTGAALLLDKQKEERERKGRTYDPEGAILAARLRYLKELSEANEEEYQASRMLREREISELDKIAKDEKKSFEDRLNAYGEMLKKRSDLLADDLIRQTAKNEEQKQVELAQSDKALRAELKQAGKNAEAIRKIRQYYADEQELILQKFASKQKEIEEKSGQDTIRIAEETSKAELEIIHKRQEAIDATEKTYRDEQAGIFKKIADNEKLYIEIRQSAFREYVNLKKKELDIDEIAALAKAGNNEEEIKAIKARFAVLRRELDSFSQNSSPYAKSLEAANSELEKLKKNVTDAFLGKTGFGALSKFFDGTFKNAMAAFDLITTETQEWGDKMDATSERALKKFQYTFSTITDLAKTAFKTINELNQAQFQAQYERLEKQRDISIQFAGESEAARAEIEEQYEARRRQIAREEARQKKQMAIFEAVIDTATAVVAALPNYALAAAVGILGAAQIALIAAQPLPEFWKGTDNAPEGLAWTQEKGREIITDKHGNVKSLGSDNGAQLTKLSKGDKVFNASKTSELLAFNADFNRLMTSNNIITTNNVGKSTDVDYGRIGKEVGKALSKRPQLNISLDKDGFNMHLNSRNNKITYINNRVSGKADTV